MAQIPIDQLEPGMTTAKAIKNKRGQVLIPGGVELLDRHISGLKSFGVKYVHISTGDISDRVAPPDEKTIIAIATKLLAFNSPDETSAEITQIRKFLMERHMERLREFPQRVDEQILRPLDNIPPVPEVIETWKNRQVVLQQAGDLFTLPNLYQKLIQVMDRPDATIKEMGDIIANDPALAARLLKVANSAYYSLNSRLDTISRAIMVIGIKDLKNLVLASTVTKQFSERLAGKADMATFWQHSIAVAVLAKNLAIAVKLGDEERYFLAGLLHDIGKLVMYAQFPDIYAAISQQAFCENIPQERFERQTLGYAHYQLGAALLERWNFPPSISDCAHYQHNPTAFRKTNESRVVHVANGLAHLLLFDEPIPSQVPVIDKDPIVYLKLTPTLLTTVIEKSIIQVEELCAEFLPEAQ